MTHPVRNSFLKTVTISILLAGAAALASGGALAQSTPSSFTITILHSNDTHDNLDPITLSGKDAKGADVKASYGGVARIKTLIDQLTAKSTNPIVLDAGDAFTGTLYGTVYKGATELAYLTAWGVQAQTLGNHEFDGGPAQLAPYLKAATYPVLSSNIDVSNEPLLKGLIKPSTVLDVRGEKIGVVGVTTPETPITSSPGPTVKFLDPVASVQKAVDDLKAQGINKIILLSHLGYDVDTAIAPRLHDIDVIIGGHSHTPLGSYAGVGLPAPQGNDPTVVRNADGNPVLITQAWEYGKFYGDLRVTFDAKGVPVSWKGQTIPVTDAYKPNPTLDAAVKAFAVPLEAFRKQVVGTAAILMNGNRTEVRQRETNLGNFVADAFLWKTQNSGAVISLQNGGGIRASIEAGQVTTGQVIAVQPFGNTVYLIDLTGAEVTAALENGVSQWETGAGRFMQVGGLKYSVDLAKPVGARVSGVQVGNAKDGYKPIDPAATYRVVTNNFVAGGGDGFNVLKNAKGARYDTGIPDYIAFTDYFNSIKNANPSVEGRITIVNEPAKK